MSENVPLLPHPLNSSHWGAFEPVVVDERVTKTRPFAKDPGPSILRSVPDALHHRSRVADPAVRAGWLKLKHAPAGAREQGGSDSYINVRLGARSRFDRRGNQALDSRAGQSRSFRRVIRTEQSRAIHQARCNSSASRRHRRIRRRRDTFSNAVGAVWSRTYSAASTR